MAGCQESTPVSPEMCFLLLDVSQTGLQPPNPTFTKNDQLGKPKCGTQMHSLAIFTCKSTEVFNGRTENENKNQNERLLTLTTQELLWPMK